MSWWRGVAVLSVLAVGCGDSTTTLSADAGQEPATSPAEELGCFGERPYFTADDVEGPTRPPDDEESRALAVWFADSESAAWDYPEDGWRLLGADGTRAVFVTDELRHAIQLERVEDGPWQAVRSGCTPRPVRAGLENASWELRAEPAEESMSFEAFVTEMSCTGGRTLDPERIVGPEIRYDHDSVVVTFFVEPVPREDGVVYGCPGNPPTAQTVILAEPLAGRTLLDGSTFPPQPPERPSWWEEKAAPEADEDHEPGQADPPEDAGEHYAEAETPEGRAAVELVSNIDETGQHSFQLANRGEVMLHHGLSYELERWSGEEWAGHPLPDGTAFLGVGLRLGPGNESSYSQSVQHREALTPGWYRVVKTADYEDPGHHRDPTTLTVRARFRMT